MSKDIRLYFKSKTTTRDDDSDVIPESPQMQAKNKSKKTRRKRALSDDSDESSPKKIHKKAPENEPSKKKTKPSGKTLKEVKPSELFGGGLIKRSEPLVKKPKATETGIHSDNEFELSLIELDQIEEIESAASTSEKTRSDKGTNKTKAITDETTESSKNKTKFSETKPDNKINETETREISRTKDSDKSRNRTTKAAEDGVEIETTNSRIKVERQSKDNMINAKERNSSKKESGSRIDKLKINGIAKEASRTDFSQFIEDADDHKREAPKGKKQKLDTSLNESVLTDEERHERRIHSAALYKSYLNRSGPKHLGEKKIPQGSPDCLKDCAFVLTGVLDSFEKEDIAKAIANFGGCVKSAVTKKVTHVLAGEDAGPAKLAKAQELNIKIIDEDEFLQMVVDLTNKRPMGEVKPEPESAKKRPKKEHPKSPTDSKQPRSHKTNSTSAMEKAGSEIKKEVLVEKTDLRGDKRKCKSEGTSEVIKEADVIEAKTVDRQTKPESTPLKTDPQTNSSMLWVDKYKPQSSKSIIGQHGPASKTTTVTLVCKELGFDVVEFNASDTRNKALIREQIGELLTTNSLSAYARGDTSKQAVTKKHVLVMDEVDGMAGNEDRGGLQELIGLIKSTSVPIICTCNDRNSPKMRSLVNYCYDLRFKRPTIEQIRSALMSVCFKEGIKAPRADVMGQIAAAAGQDVRHALHLASLWAASPTPTPPPAPSAPSNGNQTRQTKDVKLGPWEAVRKVFTAAEHASMSINEKSDLFFYDYSLAPLFVQENYLQAVPHCPKNKVLERFSMAADSISMGDLVEARIRGSQSWNLLPTQAMFSSVIPGHAMAGHLSGQIQFPGWLGKNSRANKMRRLAQEIHAHTRLSTSGSKSSIFLDYCTHLRDAVISPLIKSRADGVAESLQVLQSYHLLREDLDSLIELSLWPGQRNPMVLVESKVKAAMTRAYNKRAAALPYAPPEGKRTARDATNERPEDSDAEEDAYDMMPDTS
ncbi:unnamed protein product, partial [Iphiclides podalirius]